MPRCNHPLCRDEGVYVHRWKDADTGEIIMTECYCREHDYPRNPNKSRGRFREKDGSLTTYVREQPSTAFPPRSWVIVGNGFRVPADADDVPARLTP